MAEKIRQSRSLRNAEVHHRRKTAEHSVLFGALETMEVAGERYVLGTAFDISDRKRAEDRGWMGLLRGRRCGSGRRCYETSIAGFEAAVESTTIIGDLVVR